MKRHVVSLATLVFAAFATKAGATTAEKVTPIQKAQQGASARAKECPKGFTSIGSIIKIERANDGKVTEIVQMTGGTIQRMPPFKPTASYDSKVGDAYCMDMMPSND